MTSNRKHVLAYCIHNKEIAREIDKTLSQVDFELEHVNCDEFEDGETFYNKLQLKNLPVIILYSDNFFKTESCMLDALSLLKDSHLNLIPIITDGKYKKDGEVNYTYEPTEFTRIGNLIRYMNFWQDQYLELRKNRKDVPSSDIDHYNIKLSKIKSISGEVGEFLRLLRDKNPEHYETLKSNNFEGLFKKLGQPELHKNFLSLAGIGIAAAAIPTSSSNTIIEDIINENANEIIEEVASTSNNNIHGVKITGNNQKDISLSPVGEITNKETVESTNKDKPFFERLINEIIPKQKPRPKGMHYIEDLAEKSPEEVEIPQESTIDIEAEVMEESINLIPGSDSFLEQTNSIETEEQAIEEIYQPASVKEEPEVEILQSKINEDNLVINDEDFQEVVNENADLLVEEITNTETVEELTVPSAIMQIEEEDLEEGEDIEISPNLLSPASPEELEEKALFRNKILDAKKAIDEGMVKEGMTQYQQLITEYPQNTEVRLLYAANLAKRLHDHDQASKELEKILEINDQDADAYHLLAEIAETHKDFILAKNYYEKTISIDSSYPNVHYKIGRIIANNYSDQKKMAADYFKTAIKKNKRHVDAHYQYAILLNEHFGKYSKAIKHFKKALKLNPLHPFAAYDLALIYHKLYEPDIAADYYQKASKNNPEIKTAQNDAVFLELDVNNITNLTPIEAFEKGLQFEKKPTIEDKKPANTEPAKVVVITGATSGIGKATADIFAKNGYRLILTGRRTDRLGELQDYFEKEYNNEVHVLPFDVRDVNTVKSLINDLSEEWKNIDILINNAGLAKGYAPIHEGDIEDWETMIDTNIKGLLYMTRAVAPHMVKRKNGHIINICSTAATDVYPNGNVYCATKSAVNALTKAMRLDLFKHNIKVSQISPAHVEQTEFALVRFDGDQDRAKIYNNFNPLTSADVAASIYFMATQPAHVNIRDIVLSGNQQATNTDIDNSGRMFDAEEEE